MGKLLTAPAVKKLKPTAKRREIRDAGLPGLALIIQPGGAKSWAFRYRYGKTSRKLTLGTVDVLGSPDDTPRPEPALGGHLTLAEARKLASDARHEVALGGDPAKTRRQTREAKRERVVGRSTFTEIAKDFVLRYAKPKNRTWRETARLLGLRPHPEKPGELVTLAEWDRLKADKAADKARATAEEAAAAGRKPRKARKAKKSKKSRKRVAAPCDRWHNRDIGSIAKRDIRDLLDEIVAAGSGVAANRMLAALRKFFNWTVDDRDILTTSPCEGVPKPADEESRDRVLSEDEIRVMWKAAEKQGYPWGPFAQLLLLTAQRREEVAGMTTTAELDLKQRVWRIPKGRAKNKKPSEVPLSDAALAIIEKLPRIEGVGFLFTRSGKTPVSGFSRAKRRLDELMNEQTKGLEIPGWGYHDLRRTAATGMAALGVAQHITESVLNHKSGVIRGVGAIYNRFEYKDQKRAALEAWARRVDEIVTGKSSKVIAFPARA